MTMWLAVALGGAIGASLRYGLNLLLPISAGKFPWATFVANGTGALLIGFFFVLIVEKSQLNEHWRLLISVGLLGGLTTFSSFALESVIMWQQGFVTLALTYIITSLFTTLFAVLLAISLTRMILS